MTWAFAYAIQARSDLEARETLLRNDKLPECHQLHFLQMACEKLCKAHLIAGGADARELQKSHAYVAKQLPIIVRLLLAREAGRLPRDTWIISAIRVLARRIELLAPSVDHGGRVPANSEYPWERPDGQIVAPARHNFEFSLLRHKAGITLLKVLRVAIDELLQPDKSDS